MPSSGAFEHRGCSFGYDVVGEGPPVLFVQGVGLHGPGWAPQTAALASGFRCISMDNRGIGRSQPPAVKITVEQMAEDCFALLDHLEIPDAHLVGHSLGGVVVQAMALGHPDRVRSLSLLCTVSRGKNATRMSGRMLWLGLASNIGTRRSRRAAFLRIVAAPGTIPAGGADRMARELEPLFGHDLGVGEPIAMKQLGALRGYDSTERLAELGRTPTLVVSGAHDLIAPPRFGRALAAGIPGSKFVRIEEGAHGLTIQLADRVNVLLRDHLATAENARREPLATGVGE